MACEFSNCRAISSEIVNESKCGILINEFNESEYLKSINQIDELLKTPKEEIIAAGKNHFSLENGITKYKKVYEALKA